MTMQAAQGRLVGISGACWGPCSVPWGSCAVTCPVRPHSQGWKGSEILQAGQGASPIVEEELAALRGQAVLQVTSWLAEGPKPGFPGQRLFHLHRYVGTLNWAHM